MIDEDEGKQKYAHLDIQGACVCRVWFHFRVRQRDIRGKKVTIKLCVSRPWELFRFWFWCRIEGKNVVHRIILEKFRVTSNSIVGFWLATDALNFVMRWGAERGSQNFVSRGRSERAFFPAKVLSQKLSFPIVRNFLDFDFCVFKFEFYGREQ